MLFFVKVSWKVPESASIGASAAKVSTIGGCPNSIHRHLVAPHDRKFLLLESVPSVHSAVGTPEEEDAAIEREATRVESASQSRSIGKEFVAVVLCYLLLRILFRGFFASFLSLCPTTQLQARGASARIKDAATARLIGCCQARPIWTEINPV